MSLLSKKPTYTGRTVELVGGPLCGLGVNLSAWKDGGTTQLPWGDHLYTYRLEDLHKAIHIPEHP